MGMPDDLAGKVIKYAVPARHPADTSKVKDGVLTGHTESKALQPHDVIGSLGASSGRQFKTMPMLWNFTWLYYVPGWVTVAPLTSPVLTGPMSGCYLFKYMEGGNQFIAHVGTEDEADHPASIAAKKAWKAFISRPEISNVMGADPSALISIEERTPLQGKMLRPPKVVGYFDGAGVAWVMVIGEVESIDRVSPMPGLAKIRTVKPMPLAKWSTVALTKKFND